MITQPVNVTGVTYNSGSNFFNVYSQLITQSGSTTVIYQKSFDFGDYHNVLVIPSIPPVWVNSPGRTNGSGFYTFRALNSGNGSPYSGVATGSSFTYLINF